LVAEIQGGKVELGARGADAGRSEANTPASAGGVCCWVEGRGGGRELLEYCSRREEGGADTDVQCTNLFARITLL
jgi:hypothetical protein